MNPIDDLTNPAPTFTPPPEPAAPEPTNSASAQAQPGSSAPTSPWLSSSSVPPSIATTMVLRESGGMDWQMFALGGVVAIVVLALIGVDLTGLIQTGAEWIQEATRRVLLLFGVVVGQGTEVAGKGIQASAQGAEEAGQEVSEAGQEVKEKSLAELGGESTTSADARERDVTYPGSMRGNEPGGLRRSAPVDSSGPRPAYISSTKGGPQWCLAGTFQGKRGCAPVDAPSQCMSASLFPSQAACMSDGRVK